MHTTPSTPDPLKHGIYAAHLTRQEHQALRKMPYDDLNPEIAILRLTIARLLDYYNHNKDVETAVLISNAITHAARALNTLIRTHTQLDDDRYRDPLDEALKMALHEEPFYLTGDPPPYRETLPELSPEEEELYRQVLNPDPEPDIKKHPTHFRPIRRRPHRRPILIPPSLSHKYGPKARKSAPAPKPPKPAPPAKQPATSDPETDPLKFKPIEFASRTRGNTAPHTPHDLPGSPRPYVESRPTYEPSPARSKIADPASPKPKKLASPSSRRDTASFTPEVLPGQPFPASPASKPRPSHEPTTRRSIIADPSTPKPKKFASKPATSSSRKKDYPARRASEPTPARSKITAHPTPKPHRHPRDKP